MGTWRAADWSLCPACPDGELIAPQRRKRTRCLNQFRGSGVSRPSWDACSRRSAFDEITILAAQTAGVPIALVGLLTTRTFGSGRKIVLSSAETSREGLSRLQAILSSNGPGEKLADRDIPPDTAKQALCHMRAHRKFYLDCGSDVCRIR
jgi:hypothetical protein